MKRIETQQGVALVIVLVLLTLIALIGATSMQTTTVQESMTSNQKDMSVSFNSAEAALRAAETYLNGNSIGAFDGTVTGLYYSTANNIPDWKNATTTGWITRTGTLPNVSSQPEYFIEELPTVYDPTTNASADTPLQQKPLYRVTARGYGPSTNGHSVLQTVFKR